MKPYFNVMIAIPTRGHVQIGLLPALFDWKEKGASIVIETAILIDNARNRLVRAFLDSDREYLLFVDSDIAPGLDALGRLMGASKDVVTGYHNVVQAYDSEGRAQIVPSSCVTLTENPDGTVLRELVNTGEGIVKVEGAATSFMLINRRVFKGWDRPWFRMKWNGGYTDFIGEDYWFCIEARKRGFGVWTDTDLCVRHVKEVML